MWYSRSEVDLSMDMRVDMHAGAKNVETEKDEDRNNKRYS